MTDDGTHRSDERGTPLSPSVIGGLVACGDMICVAGAGLAGYLVYPGWSNDASSTYVFTLIVYPLLLVPSFYSLGLYRFEAIVRPTSRLGRMLAIYFVIFLLLVTLAFALKLSVEFSRIWAFTWLLSGAVCLSLGRGLARYLVYRFAQSGRLGRNVLVIGTGEQAQKLLRHLNRSKEPWSRVIGIFDDRLQRTAPSLLGHPVRGNLDDLVQYVRAHRCDDVLVALPWTAVQRIVDIVEKLRVLPVHVGISPDLVGVSFAGSTYSRYLGLPVLDVYDKPLAGWNYLAKALFDRVFGAIFLLLAAPAFLLIAAAIRCETPGPVFFRQYRYGFNNGLIPMLKFRSMYVHLQDDDAHTLTTANDARVTRVGGFLRRTSLDELPQLINVVRGDMSLVGPRPHALQAKAAGRLYDDVVAGYALRHKVKPGITGWAQVNGWRGETDTQEKIIKRVDHDLYYIENWSLLFDLLIILRTAWECLRGRNAY